LLLIKRIRPQIACFIGCCLLGFLLVSCHGNSHLIQTDIWSAQVTRVINGQTIEVTISERELSDQRVRILGLDLAALPDKSWQDGAKIRLQELIANQVVRLELESSEPDAYQRLLAHVWQNDTLISEQLAQEGYVLVNDKYPHKYSDRLFYAQEYARTLDYGIWQ